MRATRVIVGMAACAMAWAQVAVAAEPVGTAFTYQGQLKQGAVPVNGIADFEFHLWDAETGGTELASNSFGGVSVDNGLFTVQLAFDAGLFDGSSRYLEVHIAVPSGGALIPLAGRQPITAVPYALYALDAPGGGDSWDLIGNAGTTPGANFVGTTDDQPLELRVGGVRALRIEPNATSPNLIGGYRENTVSLDVVGATIGGGGSGGATNRVTDKAGAIGGGEGNQAGDDAGTTINAAYATVAGGTGNTAYGLRSTIGGGRNNTASGINSTVGGGASNAASDNNSTISGGVNNVVSGDQSTIAGGSANTVSGDKSTVGGGEHNTASGNIATIPGGSYNEASGSYSLAAGQRAQANHTGTFVWSDSTTTNPDFFFSTGPNQFLIKATGGVGINTNTPGAALHIGGAAGVDGLMFPDGTLQKTAVTAGSGGSLWSNFGSMIYYTAGRVGIGTAIPLERLHVVGDTRLDGSVTIGDTPLEDATLGLVAGDLYGVQAQTPNAIGAAIAGEATYGEGGGAHGVYGITNCPNAAGVYGSGADRGVEGVCNSDDGIGVYGHHSGLGSGVFGNTTSSGVNYGVRGESASTSGFGGHFINTSSDGTALYARSAGAGTGDATLQVHNTQPNAGMAAYLTSVGSYATMHAKNDGTGEVLWLSKDNAEGEFIVAHNEVTGRMVFTVDHDGWTKVSVLEITGGSDLSEQFDVASNGADVEPGMVVAIDAENPGKLVVANRPYDYTVAGVVSGAGGVKPGMLMGQRGTLADGQHPIALTGRVWTWCDASRGAIKPGDLLTTSSVPGHAMKVTDRTRAQGAIIGKAMTSLESGKGLVLLLVSLQ